MPMNDDQRKGAAAGFMHVLKHSPAVFEKWDAGDPHDAQSMGKLVQESLGLKEQPDHDDLTAMAAHAKEHLKTDLDELQTRSKGVPKTVGNVYAAG